MRHVDLSKQILRSQTVRLRRRAPRRRRLRIMLLIPLAAVGSISIALAARSEPAPAAKLEAMSTEPLPEPVPPAPPVATQARATTTTATRVAAAEPAAARPPRRIAWRPVAPKPQKRVIRGAIGKGSSLLAALQSTGLARESLYELLDVAGKVIDFRRCRSQDRYRLIISPGGAPERLEYYGSGLVVAGAHRKGGRLVPFKRTLAGDHEVQVLRGDIGSSLEGAVVAAGGTPRMAANLADLFAWDLDFNLDTRRGDSFTIAVQRFRLPDGSHRFGTILAARYSGDGGRYEAFRFRTGKKAIGYFDGEGRPLRRRYLASPLPFVRVTSRFGRRWHPILRRWGHHGGIDYAAPRGTPIWAVANGRVAFAGRKGGYGKLVILKHRDGNKTYYAHMSRLGKGLRKGSRITQKQVIGYVGSTGRSTGPHLHFAMRNGGRFVNPTKMRGRRAAPLGRRQLRRFRHYAERMRAKMTGLRVAMITRR